MMPSFIGQLALDTSHMESIEITSSTTPFDVAKFFGGRIRHLLPFETLPGSEYSPFSPLFCSAGYIEECRGKLRDITGSIVVVELLVPEVMDIQGDYDCEYEFDLRTGEGRARLLDCEIHREIMEALRDKKVRILVHGIEVIEEEMSLDGSDIYRLHNNIRRFEDSLENDSVLIGAVTAGKRLPFFSVMRHSPSFLSANKVGFVDELGFTVNRDDAVKARNFQWATNHPRKHLNLVQGEDRRAFYKMCIEDVLAGENLMVLGPRRGGKSSLVSCALKSVGKNRPEMMYCSCFNIKRELELNLFDFEDDEDRDRVWRLINETDLDKLPEVLKGLIDSGVELSGKHLLFVGDEVLEGHRKDEEFLYGFFCFAKRAKELMLPISFFIVVTDYVYPEVYDKVANHENNVTDVHLSAFRTAGFGFLSDEESRELLESLLKLATFKFGSDDDKERFIDRMVCMCSGQVEALNFAVARLESGSSVEECVSFVQEKTDRNFGIYLEAMTGFQRSLVSRCVLSEGLTCFVNEAGQYMDEIEAMRKRGYIKCHFTDQAGKRMKITLIRRAFIRVVASAYEKLVENLAERKVFEYMRFLGVDDGVVRLSKELYWEDEPEYTSDYAAARALKEEKEKELKALLKREVSNGTIDINLAFQKDRDAQTL